MPLKAKLTIVNLCTGWSKNMFLLKLYVRSIKSKLVFGLVEVIHYSSELVSITKNSLLSRGIWKFLCIFYGI